MIIIRILIIGNEKPSTLPHHFSLWLVQTNSKLNKNTEQLHIM